MLGSEVKRTVTRKLTWNLGWKPPRTEDLSFFEGSKLSGFSGVLGSMGNAIFTEMDG